MTSCFSIVKAFFVFGGCKFAFENERKIKVAVHNTYIFLSHLSVTAHRNGDSDHHFPENTCLPTSVSTTVTPWLATKLVASETLDSWCWAKHVFWLSIDKSQLRVESQVFWGPVSSHCVCDLNATRVQVANSSPHLWIVDTLRNQGRAWEHASQT